MIEYHVELPAANTIVLFHGGSGGNFLASMIMEHIYGLRYNNDKPTNIERNEYFNNGGRLVLERHLNLFFRMDPDVPLIVPQVNPEAIKNMKKNIIANPNCSTAQLVIALKPLHDLFNIVRIVVSTYQSVSGGGKDPMDELIEQTKSSLENKQIKPRNFTKQIAFNAIPHIDTFQDNGYTREEMKMVWETQKIFEDENLLVNPTAVRIPVVYGHSEAVHIETKRKITAKDARDLLEKADGITVVDDRSDGGYATPFTEATNNDSTFVSRIREDISHERVLNLWVVSDNIRKGAALNTIQIAEILIKDYIS